MTFQIIAERDNTILVLENNKIKTYPNDFYNELKLKKFNGDRIILDMFSKEKGIIKITETFNRGIFNVEYMGEVIQFRDKNIVCLGIKQWLESNETTEIENAYVDLWKKNNETKIMEMLAGFFGDRVTVVDCSLGGHKGLAFDVDGLFRINKQGTCYTQNVYRRGRTVSQETLDDKWSSVCIVPDGTVRPFSIMTKIGKIDLTSNDVVILSKVGFLLSPKKIYDSVFFDQLTPSLKKVLIDEVKQEAKDRGVELKSLPSLRD